MKKRGWVIFNTLIFAVACYIIVQYFIMDGTQAGLVQMKLLFLDKLSPLWYMMLFIHITTSLVSLIIGPFTLSKTFREKNLKRHRQFGKVYMVGILFGGLSGLYLACYATGGFIAKLGFVFLSLLWLQSAYKALRMIGQRNISAHQYWMIRNYSLTFAAVTLRLWLPLFMVLFGLENFEVSYAIIAWLAWVPNLIFGELFIKYTKRQETNIEGNLHP
ncbi:DUF2306 domain-containing protein [Priestia endophytica]|jgi:uncharacterized membrane protein|uniref:DUF2306 domain-containing protein n=1 Tax=Priestia endophytica TaxID=135735 RepID=UPI002E202E8A|nr:DUF2306 domain-containing protein [Priestia endophytica]